ncbi:MAG: NUDIX domain-containing protein [Patescibacteria group bacterium]
MSDELVDVVNQNDQVTGQALRSKCHADYLLHRGSALLVFEDDSLKKILVTKRSATKGSNPGKFCFPGGHVAAGETYLVGAQREYWEELYSSKKPFKDVRFEELYKVQYKNDQEHELHTVFRIVDSGPFRPDPNEVARCFFVDTDKLKLEAKLNNNFTSSLLFHLSEYKKRY